MQLSYRTCQGGEILNTDSPFQDSIKSCTDNNELLPLPWDSHKGFLWGFPATLIELLIHPMQAMKRPQLSPWYNACFFNFLYVLLTPTKYDIELFMKPLPNGTAWIDIVSLESSIILNKLAFGWILYLLMMAIILKLSLKVVHYIVEIEVLLVICSYLFVPIDIIDTIWSSFSPLAMPYHLIPMHIVTGVYLFFMVQGKLSLSLSFAAISSFVFSAVDILLSLLSYHLMN